MAEEQRGNEVALQFKGTGFQAFGWGLFALALTILVIPAAWGAVALYRWFVRNLSFSDGTKASFDGRAKEVWGYFVILTLLSFLPRFIDEPGAEFIFPLIFAVLLMPLTVAIGLKIMRWFFAHLKLSDGTIFSFKGRYGQYLGWSLLVTFSAYTIIGWAWAMVAMIRWICRNLDAGQSKVTFTGTGWNLLWRGVVAGLASLLIIPLPWMVVWMAKWYVKNLVVEKVN